MESKSKEMAAEMDKTIEKLNEEASALEEEKEKKAVSVIHPSPFPLLPFWIVHCQLLLSPAQAS